VLSFVRAQFTPGLRPASKGILPFRPEAVVEGAAWRARPVTMKVLAFFEADTRAGIAATAPCRERNRRHARRSGARRLKSPLETLDLLYPERATSRTLATGVAAGTVSSCRCAMVT